MKTRTVAKDFTISDLGYGAMSLSHGYGEATPDADAIKTLRQAFDCGYTFFDTAEVYGPYRNEELLGKALRPFYDQIKVTTKFGIAFSEYTHGDIIPDARPETIRKSVEGSLKRLQIDAIDLYLQHRIDPKVEPEIVADVMGNLIKEGKIKHWGVCVASDDYIRRAHAVTPITAVQDRYSMMARGIERQFPLYEELGIGFIAYSPLANGLLSSAYSSSDFKYDAATDYRAKMPQFSEKALQKNRDLIAFLNSTADKHSATLSQISLAWILGKYNWITALPSSRKLERIVENAGGSVIELSQAEIKAIDEALDKLPKSDIYGSKNN